MKYRLTVVRHGETNENRLGIIQGQMDCPLSEVGLEQARKLGRRLGDEQEKFTHVFSSDLQRALQTAVVSLDEMAQRNQRADVVVPAGPEPVEAGADSGGGYPKIVTDRLLRECCFGEGEGKTRAELATAARRVGQTLSTYTPVGGETDAQLQGRARTFFGKLNALMRSELGARAATAFAATPGVASCDGAAADVASSPHVALYAHGGWIRVLCDVLMSECRFSTRQVPMTERVRLRQVPPNTGLCRFVVELGLDDDVVGGGGMSSRSHVECTMVHDARHLDAGRE